MRRNGGKLRIEDLKEKDLQDARDIAQYVIDMQVQPANAALGYPVLLSILKGHWRHANKLSDGLRDGLYDGLSDGLEVGLDAGLDVGLRAGLSVGLRVGLDDGLDVGLRAGLDDGLDVGLRAGLDVGLYAGLYAKPMSLAYCGVWWSRWVANYLIASQWGVKLDMQKLALLHAFCKLCPIIGKTDNDQPTILPKPTKIRWQITGKTAEPFHFPVYELHGNGCPSVEYPGMNLYHWHNTKIPERMGQVNCEHWNPEWIVDEQNAEVRRILIREIGYERAISTLGARVRNTWREYELLQLDVDMPVRYQLLKMTCPSTGDVHVLRAPPDVETAEQAITWCNHGIHPSEFECEN